MNNYLIKLICIAIIFFSGVALITHHIEGSYRMKLKIKQAEENKLYIEGELRKGNPISESSGTQEFKATNTFWSHLILPAFLAALFFFLLRLLCLFSRRYRQISRLDVTAIIFFAIMVIILVFLSSGTD